ncbi:MAG TPA: thioredoxin domain-containing protein [Candidatus Eisenbacteria bacterium]|nr:thioredoxin domain-containing protein [Candidatus Eisenbacteria bacterium]
MSRRLRLLPAGFVAILGCASILTAAPTTQKSQTHTTTKKTAHKELAEPAVSTATISVDGVNDIDPDKAFGSKSAKVVVEIFSDFQCPACRALYMNTNQKVMDNYVDTGKIYLVHRDFPLPMHAYSRVAASYSRAACHIGKCEPVERVLFDNQEKWEASGDVKGTVASVLTPGEMKRVEAIVASKELEPLIEKDKAIGQTFPVSQTPTTVFHANGQTYPYAGTLTYDVLKDFLDQLIGHK